jgi:hypothetical protein
VLWTLNTDAQWHMLPQCCPNYKTVHRRFQAWCRSAWGPDGHRQRASRTWSAKSDRCSFVRCKGREVCIALSDPDLPAILSFATTPAGRSRSTQTKNPSSPGGDFLGVSARSSLRLFYPGDRGVNGTLDLTRVCGDRQFESDPPGVVAVLPASGK